MQPFYTVVNRGDAIVVSYFVVTVLGAAFYAWYELPQTGSVALTVE